MEVEIRRVGAGDMDLFARVAPEVFDEPVRPDRLAAYLAEAVAGLEDADLAEWRTGAVRYPGPPAEATEANR